MVTIFDFNPTAQELVDIRFDGLSLCLKFGIDTDKEPTPEFYKENVTQDNAYYDLACLFEFRGDQKTADEYWSKLPKTVRENGLGLDCIDTAS